jgi:hypothetical protein
MGLKIIDEVTQTNFNHAAGVQKLKGKSCIYYPEAGCSAPKLQFRICRSCPRAEQYIRKNILTSLYNYVKSIANSLLKSVKLDETDFSS